MKNWKKILREINQIKSSIDHEEGVVVWFRGQADANWKLESSLHRYLKKAYSEANISISNNQPNQFLRGQYKSLYHKYKTNGWTLFSEQERNDWGIVFSMRHHGIPTTLLDWTESFLNALYFANYNRDPHKDAAIYILNPPKLNEQSIGKRHLIALEEKFHDKANINSNVYHPRNEKPKQMLPTIAVSPVRTNQRMVAQQSHFMICGDSFNPVDEEHSECIKKIVLPAETYKISQEYLKANGINHFSLFPDLYGLCLQLKHELDDQLLRCKKS